MTILVTGGAGFIGSNFILEWLASSNRPVVNLDKLTYSGNPANLEAVASDSRYSFVHAGIEDSDAVADILAQSRPTAVVNFAAETHVDRSILGPEAFVATNVTGTFRLLGAVKAYWETLPAAEAEAFRFFHVSTDEVYGTLTPDAPPFTENHPFRPNSPYSASKASADHFVRAYGETYGLPVLISNCSNNYGPRQFPEKLIPLMIHNALAGKPLPVYGDGQQIRDWLHVADHCAAIRLLIERGTPGETYNIGGSAERPNLEVVRTICAVLDEMVPRPAGGSYAQQIAFVKDRPGHDRRYAVDTGKIHGAFGWVPRFSFEQGIRDTVGWYVANRDWVANVTSGSYRDWVAKQYA